MSRPTAPSVDAYSAAILEGLPTAVESISYAIPTFTVGARPVLYCAAFRAHYSVYPATTALITALGDALAPYEYNGTGTIRFPLTGPVPTALITRIARLRAAEEAARQRPRRAAAKKR